VEADRQLSGLSGVRELVHMTHFSSADEALPTTLDPQLALFGACHGHHSEAPASLANSAALLSRPDTHADWVRPGLMLYGINPLGRAEPPLRAAMRLSAKVIAVRSVRRGETVGYNRQWVASRDSQIATIGIGYGDGYPRHAPSGTPVWIKGHAAALAGRVSMDSIGVDVTDCRRVDVGDEAVLWGPELSAALVAERAGTISYALFTGVTGRVMREYGCA
jgi:alanine racemase